MIVEKAVKMAAMMNIPILGVVENMSYYRCPDCSAEQRIFGNSHIEAIAAAHNISNVAKLPLDPHVASACDEGTIENIDTSVLDDFAGKLV